MPKPIEIYDNPGAYWHLITTAKDVDFEDQHFDRKEAGRPDPAGTFSSSKLSEIIAHVKETISAFANTNRDGSIGNGAARFGNTRWRRVTELRARTAKSVFHFDVQGSVAKSTHAGGIDSL